MEILYALASVLFLARPDFTAEYAAIACLAIKNVVLRSLFPMTVLTKLICASSLMARLSKYLAKTKLWQGLNISDSLLPSVLSGLISGLPSSAGEIQALYTSGRATKKECSKALALSSLPSPAFVILVASENLYIGCARYLILVLTALITACFFGSRKSVGLKSRSKITLPLAISRSAEAMLTVSANIAFFSAMTCLVSSLFPFLKAAIAVFFEMGSGVIFGKGSCFVPIALGWCGLSALMQIKAFAPDISLRVYLTARFWSVLSLLGFEFILKL